MNCPHCALLNPPGSRRCDCGWDFETGRLEGRAANLTDLARHHRRIRNLGFLALVVIWGPFLWVLGEGVRAGEMIVPAACLLVPFLVLPVLVLSQPRTGASARALGAVASTTATLGLYAPILLLAGLFGRPPLWGGGALWQGSLLLVIATFWTLWVRARQALEAVWPGQATGGCLPALGLSVVCLLTGALFEFVMIGHWARQTANETSTVALLRTIGKSAAAHAEKTRCGYPETLAALDVDEAELAARMRAGPTFLRNSYTIEYHPGPRVRNGGAACPGGVESFVVTARPLTWDVDGRSSFRADGTPAIHYTSKDRPATVEDPTVGR